LYSRPTNPDGNEEPDLSAEDARKLKNARQLIELTDGGVYDNLGLEPIWKACATILVSDGGKPMSHEFVPPGLRVLRYQQVINNQVLALRKRWLIDTFQRAKRGVDQDTFDGAYWGIMSATTRYNPLATHGYSKGLAVKIANVRTDLNWFSPNEIAILEKHGYELADIAMKTHAEHLCTAPLPPLANRWPSAKLANEAAVSSALAWSRSRFLSTFTGSSNYLLR
jgi:NTE family protein